MTAGRQVLPDLDPTRLRQALRRVPTTVTVVTASTEGGPFGLVVGSFVSISLRPPLVGIFLGDASTTWPRIRAAGRFAVNVLAHDQKELCARFARSGGTEKFHGVRWRPSPSGSPLLPGVSTWLDCRLEDVSRVGDHHLAVGRVLDLADPAADAVDPLIFHGGSLHTLARRCGVTDRR